jgi:uncharacterized protein
MGDATYTIEEERAIAEHAELVVRGLTSGTVTDSGAICFDFPVRGSSTTRNPDIRALFRGAALLLFLGSVAFALDFPQLTGRVVDQADVMTAQHRSDVASKLKGLEDTSSIQLVVATVKSLQGSDVETYANELFRFWKLGQARKNNGVLLLVAPAEHKVRIEVGYGLEGSLTDALSSVIISSVIVPRFKANDYSGGIERGVDAIVSVLTTDASGWHQTVSVRPDDRSSTFDKLTTVFFALLVIVILRLMWDPSGGRRGSLIFTPGSSGGGGFSGRDSGGGGDSGGGFSGGGGSSGGGGASGSW